MTKKVKEVIVLFTARSMEDILNAGGAAAFVLDPLRARECPFALLTRNANDRRWPSGLEEHRAAFLLGRIKGLVSTKGPKNEDRWTIEFSEFALLDDQEHRGVWREGDRNPVRYDPLETLDNLGIDPSKLRFEQMPPRAKDNLGGTLPDMQPKPHNLPAPSNDPAPVGALTMAEAKKGLALTFGVASEAVEITIRG
jgi:hypothetical protein